VNASRIATIGVLLLFCVLGSRRFKTMVNPVVIVCAPWAGMLLGQQALAWFFPFGATAALLVCLAAVAFTLGAFAISLHGAVEPSIVTMRLQPRAALLWTAISWSLVCLAAANLAIFLYYGFVLGVGRMEGGGLVFYALTDAIYDSSLGWIQRALQVAVYIAAPLFAFDTVRCRRLTVGAGAFLAIVVFQGWIVANRLPMFLVLTVFILTWAVMLARRIRRPSLPLIGMVSAALAIGMVFFWYTMSRRHGGQLSGIRLATDLLTTFLGPPTAFSAHLGSTSGWHFGMLTGITIRGPLELFGLAQRNLEPIAPIPGFTVETNVFSGLSMLLEEVGIAGAAAVMMLLGAVTTGLAASFYRRPTVVKAAVLSNLYLLLFWLPVTLMSYYVYWSVELAAVGLLGSLVFSASLAVTTPTPSQRPARA